MKISVNFIESVARHQYLWYNTGMDIFVLTEPGVMDATWAGQYADGIRTQALTLKYRVLELRWPNVAASAGHTVIVNGFSRRFYRAADPAVRAAGGVPLWLAPADVCVHPDFTGATAGLLKQLKNARLRADRLFRRQSRFVERRAEADRLSRERRPGRLL